MSIVNRKERPQLQLYLDLNPKSTKKGLFTLEKLVIDPIQVAALTAFHVRSNRSRGPTPFRPFRIFTITGMYLWPIAEPQYRLPPKRCVSHLGLTEGVTDQSTRL